MRGGTRFATVLILLGAGALDARSPVPSPTPLPASLSAPAAVRAVQSVDVAAFGLGGKPEQGGLLLGTVPPGTVALRLDGKPVAFADDGRFLIGFGRDAPPDALLEAEIADGGLLRAPLRVTPRRWDIQSLPTLRKGTDPTPEFLARRKVELERIEAARAIRSESDGWRKPFVWPVTGRISGVFGSQRIYAGEPGFPHSGVDVARPAGTPIVAPADGVVILAAEAPFTIEGHLLMIDHGMGLNSAFLHLSRIDVKPGQRVTQGQLLGAIGTSGRSTGPHLHWGMKWLTERIDPQPLAGPMPAAR